MRSLLNIDRLIPFTLHCDELSGYDEEMDFLFLCETAKVGQTNARARLNRRAAERETEQSSASASAAAANCAAVTSSFLISFSPWYFIDFSVCLRDTR
jgi:hypothetical protein